MEEGLEVQDGTEGPTKELGIMHAFDPWLVTTKGVKEKLLTASKRESNEELYPCIQCVQPHVVLMQLIEGRRTGAYQTGERRKSWLEEDPRPSGPSRVIHHNLLLADLQHMVLLRKLRYPSMKCRTMLAVLDWNQALREGSQQDPPAAGQTSNICMVF
ncbi:unnamed protein product [Arctogadus glacialis]